MTKFATSKFKRKYILDLLVVLGCVLLFSCSLFGDDIFLAGPDGAFHLNRIIGLRDAFMDHQILPKIYPYTNNGYGYASPLFYCDLFLYPFAVIYYLGCPLMLSYKLMYFFYTAVGAILAYACFKKIFKEQKVYLTIFVLFNLGQYRFLDAFTRMAFGEYLALCFLPVLIYAFYEVLVEKRENYILLAAGFSLLLLSHNLSFVLYCVLYAIFMVIYIIVNRDNFAEIKKLFKTTFKAMLVAVLVTLWYTLPMLEGLISHDLWISRFGELYHISDNLIALDVLINPFMNLDIWQANAFGYILLILPILCFISKKVPLWLKIVSAIGYISILLSFDIIPIHLLPFFNFIQFAFRFNTIAYPALALSAGYAACLAWKYMPYIAIAYTLIISIEYDYQLLTTDMRISDNTPREVIYDFSNILYKDYNEIEIVGAEYLPVTEVNDYLEDTTFIKIVKDGLYEDIIYDYDRSFTKISFAYNSVGGELLMMPLSYYKGYSAYAVKDGERCELKVIDVPKYEKVGIYTLPGNYEYHIYYEGTVIQFASLAISTLAFIFIGMKEVLKKIRT